MRIRDRGGGISPKNLSQIFQYTFTTAGSTREDKGNEEEEGSGPYAMQNMAGAGADLGALSGHGGGEVGLTSGMGTLAGLGYGLPMSRIYAEHGRGTLDIVSLYGHGCDTYIKVRANPLDLL